jgi:hypothetical protein
MTNLCPRCECIGCIGEFKTIGIGFAHCSACGYLYSIEQQNTIDNQKNVIKRLQDEEEFCEKEIATLQSELAATRLKWMTGKPPCDGWYWSQIKLYKDGKWEDSQMRYFVLEHVLPSMWDGRRWSGPLLPPTDEEGEL